MRFIPETDLILNPDGSVYHLALRPGDLAQTVITVGDPDRVPHVSRFFDSIELKKQKREFVTHTGYVGKKRISVVSTGISTDNIDIVFNEIDALFNIDLSTRQVKTDLVSLDVIRIGTAGGLQADIPLDSAVASSFGIGFDGLLPFYQQTLSQEENQLLEAIKSRIGTQIPAVLYAAQASSRLLEAFRPHMHVGLTATCGGFYAPQGRLLRAAGSVPHIAQLLTGFAYEGHRFTNFEMETAGIYGLGKVMGHHCLSLSTIVANRVTEKFSEKPYEAIDALIEKTLDVLAGL